MIKCTCSECGNEAAFKDHKSAWMEGWDFVNGRSVCGECPTAPTLIPIVKPENKKVEVTRGN
jgi:hypothetical protein